jgi:hypothetical protein
MNEGEETMTVERALRGASGFLVLLSLALGYWVHPGFWLFTAFVGANLLQSAFTNACPAMTVFRKCGLRDAGAPRDTAAATES